MRVPHNLHIHSKENHVNVNVTRALGNSNSKPMCGLTQLTLIITLYSIVVSGLAHIQCSSNAI